MCALRMRWVVYAGFVQIRLCGKGLSRPSFLSLIVGVKFYFFMLEMLHDNDVISSPPISCLFAP
jgi:hypothetical protein